MASSAKKTVYFIRHAESQDNVYLRSFEAVVGALSSGKLPYGRDILPTFRFLRSVILGLDCPLSHKGEHQVLYMKEKIKRIQLFPTNSIQLVVQSPQLRARRTCEGILGGNANSTKEPSLAKVLTLDMTVERTLPEMLFPRPKAAYYQRIADFQKWLLSRSEERIVVVGHSLIFQDMLQLDFKFGNCEVWRCDLAMDNSTRKDAGSTHETTASLWTNLNRVATCDNDQSDCDDTTHRNIPTNQLVYWTILIGFALTAMLLLAKDWIMVVLTAL